MRALFFLFLFAKSAGAFPESYEKQLHRGPVSFGAANDFVFDSTTDSAGNIFVAGASDGSFSGFTSNGGLDAWVAKFNSSGVLQWVQQIGTSATEGAYCVTADSAGSVVIAGFTDGIFSGQTSAGGRDAFAVKYSAAGVQQWISQWGTAGDDLVYACTRDLSNNPIFAGSTTGAFSGYTNAGSIDMFVNERTGAGGASSWVRQLGTSGDDELFGIGLDSSNRPYVVGYTSGSFSGYTNAGGYDFYMARLSATGTLSWNRQAGTTGDDYAFTVPCRTNGTCYPAGLTMGTWTGQTALGGEDAWVAAYTATGTRSWIRQFGTTGDDAVKGGRMDGSNRPVLVGTTNGAFTGFTNKGYNDLFYTRYATTGTVNQAPVQSGTSGQDSVAANGYLTQAKLSCGGASNRAFSGFSNLKGFDAYSFSFAAKGTLTVSGQAGTSD